MTFFNRCLAAALFAALVCACGEAPVRRVVTLAAEDGLPRGATVLAGSTLRLDLAGLEQLAPGRRFCLWASSRGTWLKLADVTVGSTALRGQAWELVDELMVTDEDAMLGAAPGPHVLFRGPLGGPLPFQGAGGPTHEGLAAATVKLVLENQTMTAHVESLPSLIEGAFYGVWLLADSEGGAEPEGTFLGALGPDDSQVTGDELLADHHQAVLTLELENGLETMGPVVMRGTVLGPVLLSSTPAEGGSH